LNWDVIRIYLDSEVVDEDTFRTLILAVCASSQPQHPSDSLSSKQRIKPSKRSGSSAGASESISAVVPTHISEDQFVELMTRFERLVESEEQRLEGADDDDDGDDDNRGNNPDHSGSDDDEGRAYIH
jgi:hypothetical protein